MRPGTRASVVNVLGDVGLEVLDRRTARSTQATFCRKVEALTPMLGEGSRLLT